MILVHVDDARLGRLIRALRHRRRWRQVDLALRAGVGPDAVVKLEAGRLDPMRTASIRAIVSVFGLTYEPSVRGMGADEDRLLDQRHASLLSSVAAWLSTLGWLVRPEVSYSEWGERGSVDLFAWHAPSASLLVIEVKSELVSLEATLRKLDEKVRLAPSIVRPFEWQPTSVSRLLVLPEDRTQRRRVHTYAAVLDRAFPIRSRAIRSWCRGPAGSIDGLLFFAESSPKHRAQRGQRERIRRAPTHPALGPTRALTNLEFNRA